MKQQIIIDTGPLVALLNRRDTYHNWTVEQLTGIRQPLLACESVLSEACFLLRHYPKGPQSVIELIHRGFMTIPFNLEDNKEAVSNLISKYADVPISLADACLVRMTELYKGSEVLTLDSDFHIYRKHGKQLIQSIMPN